MRTRKTPDAAADAPPETPPPAAPPAVHVIRPTAVYRPAQVRQLLGLREHTLAREIREGRLRVSRRAGMYFFLGRWLLEWLEAGEVRRPPRDGNGHTGLCGTKAV